jgi:hypothetical protein
MSDDVRDTGGINREASQFIPAAPAKIRGIQDGAAGRIHLHDEPVVILVALAAPPIVCAGRHRKVV